MNKTIEFFYEISKIPRESGNEKEISEYLCKFAKSRNLYYEKDKYNNVIIKKENSNTEPIILQAHMDMVCEKELNKEFDFEKDSIEVYEENGYLKAKGTTLGADNGIGIAQILNILDSNLNVNIEAVFTVSEETTMVGAENINLEKLKGKKLINLDGFEENTIILESASFFDIILETNYNFEEKKSEIYKISLKGMEGGHSGFEIDNNKGNSSIELANFLKKIKDVQIANFVGGTKFNVIPSNAEAIIFCTESIQNVEKLIQEYLKIERKKYKNLQIEVSEIKEEYNLLTSQDSIKFLNSIVEFKHGVFFKNERGEVTTSINLGVVDLKNQIMKIGMRSSRKLEESEVLKYVENYAKENDYKFIIQGSQPGFETKENSKLIKIMIDAFKKINNNNPNLNAVHITVETGFFKEKINGLEVAIISPEIIGAHTVEERVNIESIEKCDKWLLEIIKSI